jgi:hypothetical protein
VNELDEADVLRILARVKSFHGPQDVGDTVVASWLLALQRAGVHNVDDADAAVVDHYSDTSANPWITPGDVIARYRTIRAARLKNIDYGDVTQDVDANDADAYLATIRHRYAAIADGATLAQANALPLPPAAAHAAIGTAARRQIGRAQ